MKQFKYYFLFAIFLFFGFNTASALAEENWQTNFNSYTAGVGGFEPKDIQKPTFPKWSSAVKTHENPDVQDVITDKSFIWAVTNEGITAFHSGTGNVLWRQKVDVEGITQISGLIYGITKSGYLTAFNEVSGRVTWKKQINIKGALVYSTSSDLYVYWEKGLMRLDPKTGKQLWVVNKKDSFNGRHPLVVDDVVLQGYAESGAITVGVLYGFDRKTGKELWRNTVSFPLAKVGNTIYVQNTYFMTMDYNVAADIKAMDIHSGKVLQSFYYPRPEARPAVNGASWPNKVAISNGYVYVDVDNVILRYPFGVDPQKTKGENIGVGGVGRKWLAGPVADFIIYEFANYGLDALAADRRSDHGYSGFISPVTRLELQGRALITGQLTGRILVHDFLNSKINFVGQVPARNFKVLKQSGDYLIVEAPNKIYVYNTPNVAKLASTAIARPEAKPVKAPAIFKINNKKVDIGTEPIWVNNQMLVPLRTILQTLGATVNYDAATKKITCTKASKTIVLKIKETVAQLNGDIVGVSPAPEIYDNIAYVPLRSISQLFGYKVKWTYSPKTVEINE